MTAATSERSDWAAQQPLAYELVGGRLVRLGNEHQGPARLAVMRRIAEGVFGCAERAVAWIATPSPQFGGLSPADLANENEEGSQLALRALIRWHRTTLELDDA